MWCGFFGYFGVCVIFYFVDFRCVDEYDFGVCEFRDLVVVFVLFGFLDFFCLVILYVDLSDLFVDNCVD